MKCKHCGGDRFVAHQVCRMEILVDGDGDYIDGIHQDVALDIYDTEPAYGPFQCIGCGAEYSMLKEGKEPFSGPVEKWSWSEDEDLAVTLDKSKVTQLLSSYIDELEDQETMHIEIVELLLGIFSRSELESLGFAEFIEDYFSEKG